MTLEERLDKFLGATPSVAPDAYVHERATVIGAVTLGPKASVWPGAVLRGDINSITIGEGSNIQDNCVVHLSDDHGVKVGRHCVVGHLAMLHGCTIGDGCLVGMSATVLDGAVIGDHCIVGAGALVTKGTVVPPGSMVVGAPAKVVRSLTEAEKEGVLRYAQKYVGAAAAHRRMQGRTTLG